jgi:hypothetical protein
VKAPVNDFPRTALYCVYIYLYTQRAAWAVEAVEVVVVVKVVTGDIGIARRGVGIRGGGKGRTEFIKAQLL